VAVMIICISKYKLCSDFYFKSFNFSDNIHNC
jgi:hypothetical protein